MGRFLLAKFEEIHLSLCTRNQNINIFATNCAKIPSLESVIRRGRVSINKKTRNVALNPSWGYAGQQIGSSRDFPFVWPSKRLSQKHSK